MFFANIRMRKERYTKEQKEELISYMETHELFAKNKFSGPSGRLKIKAIWKKLATKLNTLGPNKSEEEWKRVWIEAKNKARNKIKKPVIREIKSDLTENGDRPPLRVLFSDFDKRILKILGYECANNIESSNDVSLSYDSPGPSGLNKMPEEIISDTNTFKKVTEESIQIDELEDFRTEVNSLFDSSEEEQSIGSLDIEINEEVTTAGDEFNNEFETEPSQRKKQKTSNSNNDISCIVTELKTTNEYLKQIALALNKIANK